MNGFDPWWLIAVPVLFGLGWIAARADFKHWLSESRTVPQAYLEGLNFLLNEQHDKAIDAFIEVVKLDPETTELHLALGNLFRRRGEADRALRIHQNLIDRADLPEKERENALFELAQDFLKAGMLDRAERGFAGLRDGRHRAEALRNLLRIFQMEREWGKAIEVARDLEREMGETHGEERAHMHCELAQAARASGRMDDARREVELALEADPGAIRPAIERADLLRANGQWMQAVDAYRAVETMSTDHLGLVAEDALDAFGHDGRLDEGLAWMREVLARNHSLDVLAALSAGLTAHRGIEAAYVAVREELSRTPSLLGLDKLLEAQIAQAPVERRGDLEILKRLIHLHTERLSRFVCSACGFKAKRHHWQCPGCGAWGTYSPKRMEQLVES